MPYNDSHGITHVMPTENVTAWGMAHIASCPRCRWQNGGPLFTEAEWKAYVADNAPKDKMVFTYDDLYYNEPGPVDCQKCGVKVFNTDMHLEWHNKLGV